MKLSNCQYGTDFAMYVIISSRYLKLTAKFHIKTKKNMYLTKYLEYYSYIHSCITLIITDV